jgi:class 3 adenylate cyclase
MIGIMGIPVLSIVAIVIAMITLALRKRGTGEPSCGNCGYGVQGLPTFICPECGSDLRQVGIISSSPGSNPFGRFTAALVSSWKRLIVAAVAIMALAAIAMYIAITFILNHDVFPNREVVLDPASGVYRVTLNQTGDMRHASGSFGAKSDKLFGDKLVIQLGLPNQAPDHNADFRIDLSTWSSYLYHWTGGVSPTLPPTQFNREELVKFFKEKKIDTTASAVSSEIDSLMLLIDRCRSGSLLKLAPSTARFSVVSAVDKSEAQLRTGGNPPGMFFLSLAASVWMITATSIVIVRMFKITGRTALPLASNEARSASLPASGAVARTISILFSDIKDFTAHSAAAPRMGAIELARRHRELASPIIRQRRGNLVKTIGDALLVTFDSATDAVLAGLEIQAAVAAQNAATADDTLKLRIAVATGEVMVEAGDVYGETVNLASRLQGVASPGDVVVSAATRSLVNGREVQTEAFGEHRLAGFNSPIEAFIARPIIPLPAATML